MGILPKICTKKNFTAVFFIIAKKIKITKMPIMFWDAGESRRKRGKRKKECAP